MVKLVNYEKVRERNRGKHLSQKEQPVERPGAGEVMKGLDGC